MSKRQSANGIDTFFCECTITTVTQQLFTIRVSNASSVWLAVYSQQSLAAV